MSARPATSSQKRHDVLDALRRGTVPRRALDLLAVGLGRFEPALGADLENVSRGGWGFKAVRGEYGSGKTFFGRWLGEMAKRRRFATAEVQISETETPLYQLGTVYRRLVERLSTSAVPDAAFAAIVDGWFYALEETVLAEGRIPESDTEGLLRATEALLEKRLSVLAGPAPAFASVLRAYRRAVAAKDAARAEGLLAWLSGQPNVAASVKRDAGVKGDVDHFTALGFLQGLLVVLRDSGFAGLVLFLDEVETLQRMRSDVREKSLNALRQLIDEVDGGRFPGLYLVVSGTPAFFEGPMGASRLPPLAQRLHVDFSGDPRFDNPRAAQIRLPGFRRDLLVEVGLKLRDLYGEGAARPSEFAARANDALVGALADRVTGELGGRIGVAPRLFLKKLVGELLDRIDQFPDFDPAAHFDLRFAKDELTLEEQAARGAGRAGDVALPGLDPA